MSPRVIEVRIWGHRVGAVAPEPTLGCYAFEYDPAWMRRGVELAPLTMPIGVRDARFAFPSLGTSFAGLPGLLADALPDDFGNALIDGWMARHGVPKDAINSLDRLAYMAKRGMGALTFRPPKGSSSESREPLEMKRLVETARSVLHGDFSGDAPAQVALENIIRVGTSAGGARAKAVIAWNPKTQEMRSGQFDVAQGFEHWLLKFDGVGTDFELGTSKDYGRIEYAYHLMATAAGIEMSPCRLLHENGRSHFMTRRFDRSDNTRHHVQSLCGMSHLDYKQRATHAYEQFFIAIKTLAIGDAALTQALRRMAFNVMARNCDDHTKNFAFLLREGSAWTLAPAYDVTHAHNPRGQWTAQHLMSVDGRFDDIRRADLMTVAERFGVPGAAKSLDKVRDAVERWPTFASKAEMSVKEIARVAKDFRLV